MLNMKFAGTVTQMLARHLPLVSSSNSSVAQLLARQWPPLVLGSSSLLHTCSVLEAARKGTRARKEAIKKANKKKKEATKKETVPLRRRKEELLAMAKPPRRLEDHLTFPIDNVWFTKNYKWKVYSVCEAITMHRETHHETQLDAPDSFVKAYIELNMTLDKKNRTLDNFTDVVRLPHVFETEQERSLVVISRKQEVLDYAQQMEVPLVLGQEVIKMAQQGEVNLADFKYVISELDFLPELVAIRGLMKRQFPNPKNGTAGNDLIPIIDRFMKGIEYKTNKNKFHPDFASIEVPVGNLTMTDEQIEENIATLIRNIEEKRSKGRKSDNLVSLVTLRSPPSKENFKINHYEFIEDLSAKSTQQTSNTSESVEKEDTVLEASQAI